MLATVLGGGAFLALSFIRLENFCFSQFLGSFPLFSGSSCPKWNLIFYSIVQILGIFFPLSVFCLQDLIWVPWMAKIDPLFLFLLAFSSVFPLPVFCSFLGCVHVFHWQGQRGSFRIPLWISFFPGSFFWGPFLWVCTSPDYELRTVSAEGCALTHYM